MTEPSLEEEFVDLIQKHHEGVNALVRALIESHGIDPQAVEFDLEMGVESKRVGAAKDLLASVFGGEDPYVLPPLVRLTQVTQPRHRLHGTVNRHVSNLEKPGICDNCGAVFDRETYEWSEPPCKEVSW